MLWLFNVILLMLASIAAIGSFAAYRSPKINGPEVINVMRMVKAGAWGMLAVASVAMAILHGRPAFEGLGLVLLTLLAYADAVTYTDRLAELMRSELHTS